MDGALWGSVVTRTCRKLTTLYVGTHIWHAQDTVYLPGPARLPIGRQADGRRDIRPIMGALVVRMDSGQYRLAPVRYADLQAAQQVRLAYPELDLDLADATSCSS